jgi:hypothetical protein
MTSIASSFDKQSPSMRPGKAPSAFFPVGLLRGLLMAVLAAPADRLTPAGQEDGGGRDTHHLQVYPMSLILGSKAEEKRIKEEEGGDEPVGSAPLPRMFDPKILIRLKLGADLGLHRGWCSGFSLASDDQLKHWSKQNTGVSPLRQTVKLFVSGRDDAARAGSKSRSFAPLRMTKFL